MQMNEHLGVSQLDEQRASTLLYLNYIGNWSFISSDLLTVITMCVHVDGLLPDIPNPAIVDY